VQLFYTPYCSNTIVSDQPYCCIFLPETKTWLLEDLFSDWPLGLSYPLIARVLFCYAWMCVCVCTCVYEFVRVCVCVWEREREIMCVCVYVCTVSLYNIVLRCDDNNLRNSKPWGLKQSSQQQEARKKGKFCRVARCKKI